MLEFHWQELFFLLGAGFVGSFVDAAVGGGGLITLPAFMATSVPTSSTATMTQHRFQSFCHFSARASSFTPVSTMQLASHS